MVDLHIGDLVEPYDVDIGAQAAGKRQEEFRQVPVLITGIRQRQQVQRQMLSVVLITVCRREKRMKLIIKPIFSPLIVLQIE